MAILLIAVLIGSCENHYQQRIWVGLDVKNQNYFELWFSSDEAILFDDLMGYYRISYFLKNDMLILNDSTLKFDTLLINYLTEFRFELTRNDTIYFQCLEVRIPYNANPFYIDLDSEETISKYLDPFQVEFNRRKRFFNSYLNEVDVLTNY